MLVGERVGQQRQHHLRRLGDEHAAAVADLDEPHDFERGQRLAHRSPRDAESLGELALGQQAVAGLQALDVDVGPQPIRHLLIEAAATDRLQRTRHLRQSCRIRYNWSNHWPSFCEGAPT